VAEFRSTRSTAGGIFVLVFATGVFAGVFADCAFVCVISMLAARATGRQAIRIQRVALIIGRSPFARGWTVFTTGLAAGIKL
jgi:hypothetical protein